VAFAWMSQGQMAGGEDVLVVWGFGMGETGGVGECTEAEHGADDLAAADVDDSAMWLDDDGVGHLRVDTYFGNRPMRSLAKGTELPVCELSASPSDGIGW